MFTSSSSELIPISTFVMYRESIADLQWLLLAEELAVSHSASAAAKSIQQQITQILSQPVGSDTPAWNDTTVQSFRSNLEANVLHLLCSESTE